MDSLWKSLFGLILVLAFLPVLFQFALGLIAALLPWVIVLAVIMGAVAGLSAGFVLRRRLPLPPSDRDQLPRGHGPAPVRRPRGTGRDE